MSGKALTALEAHSNFVPRVRKIKKAEDKEQNVEETPGKHHLCIQGQGVVTFKLKEFECSEPTCITFAPEDEANTTQKLVLELSSSSARFLVRDPSTGDYAIKPVDFIPEDPNFPKVVNYPPNPTPADAADYSAGYDKNPDCVYWVSEEKPKFRKNQKLIDGTFA
jgi:hypothetical protein